MECDIHFPIRIHAMLLKRRDDFNFVFLLLRSTFDAVLWLYVKVKVKLSLSALDRGGGSASRPGRFTPRERAPGTNWIGGWVGPRAVLDAMVKRKIPSPR
jgi:hypothetical protein